jgi:CSLREA domain-containing protein
VTLSNLATVTINVTTLITLTVNTEDDTDDGNCTIAHCSLREAINVSNARVGVTDTIAFNIPGAAVSHTIKLSATLPSISDPVIIDGLTEPGASCAAWPPTLLIEIDGSNTAAATPGLEARG